MNLFGPPDIQKLEAKKDVKGLVRALSYRLGSADGYKYGDLRTAAANALVRTGAPAVEPLIKALNTDHLEARRQTILTLGKIHDPQAVQPLTGMLRDKDEKTRVAAVQALGMIGHASAVEALIDAYKGGALPVQYAVSDALVKIGPPGVGPLISLLRDSSSSTRFFAAKVLGKIGDQRAIKALIQLLRDDVALVRSTSAQALGLLGDPCAVEPLVAALQDDDQFVQEEAAIALGRVGDRRAVEPLLFAIENSTLRGKVSAVKALGMIGDHRAIEPLLSVFLENRAGLRIPAALALGEMSAPQAVEPLIAALRDSTERINDPLIEALGKMGSVAVPALITVLGEPCEGELMDTILRNGVHWKATQALGKIGLPAVPPMLQAFKQGDHDERVLIGRALDIIGSPAAGLIREAFHGSETGARVDFLKMVSVSRFQALFLEDGLHDPDGSVREAARTALENYKKAMEYKPIEPIKGPLKHVD